MTNENGPMAANFTKSRHSGTTTKIIDNNMH